MSPPIYEISIANDRSGIVTLVALPLQANALPSAESSYSSPTRHRWRAQPAAFTAPAGVASDVTVDRAMSLTTVDKRSTIEHNVAFTIGVVATDSSIDTVAVTLPESPSEVTIVSTTVANNSTTVGSTASVDGCTVYINETNDLSASNGRRGQSHRRSHGSRRVGSMSSDTSGDITYRVTDHSGSHLGPATLATVTVKDVAGPDEATWAGPDGNGPYDTAAGRGVAYVGATLF